MKEKALIAMSGGVDSSVAALLSKQAGYDCVGINLKLFGLDDIAISQNKSCCSKDDVADARKVARRLGIPFYVFDFTADFRAEVLERFVGAYLAGQTPNPCVDCNRHIKFRRLLDKAAELNAACIVTGHYARVAKDQAAGRYLLKRGADPAKDQSYVLYTLTQEQLAKIRFPLGELSKEVVRELAEGAGFANARKRDSQDICFVPNGHYVDFMESYLQTTFPSGNFLDLLGNIMGRHKGAVRYTIGQRRGLGLALKSPHYVCGKNMEKNEVTLGPESALYAAALEAGDVNLIVVDRLDSPLRVAAKVRYNGPAQPAIVRQIEADRIRVDFESPQRAITPGQAVVLYDGDVVVGGGRILVAGEDC